MLLMVIERPRSGDFEAVGERFARQGRMLPEGVVYVASWIDATQARCFQLMEAPSSEWLDPWVEKWADLVDFEITPVHPSADYWRLKSTVSK
jgi:hypothetical protein